MTCKVPKCIRDAIGPKTGLCPKHFQQNRRTGNPIARPPMENPEQAKVWMPAALADRVKRIAAKEGSSTAGLIRALLTISSTSTLHRAAKADIDGPGTTV